MDLFIIIINEILKIFDLIIHRYLSIKSGNQDYLI
jgi:hypothetical protein